MKPTQEHENAAQELMDIISASLYDARPDIAAFLAARDAQRDARWEEKARGRLTLSQCERIVDDVFSGVFGATMSQTAMEHGAVLLQRALANLGAEEKL